MGIVPTHPTNTRKQLCSHPFHFERFVPRRCQSPSESARYLSSTALTEINTPNQSHCWDLGRPRTMSCQTVREPFTLPLSLHSLSLSFLQLRHAMTSSFFDVALPPGHRLFSTTTACNDFVVFRRDASSRTQGGDYEELRGLAVPPPLPSKQNSFIPPGELSNFSR